MVALKNCFRVCLIKKITVSISNVKENLFSIGRVKSVQNSEILFETISTNAKWSKKMEKLDIKKISLIEYQTDYTESLLVAL